MHVTSVEHSVWSKNNLTKNSWIKNVTSTAAFGQHFEHRSHRALAIPAKGKKHATPEWPDVITKDGRGGRWEREEIKFHDSFFKNIEYCFLKLKNKVFALSWKCNLISVLFAKDKGNKSQWLFFFFSTRWKEAKHISIENVDCYWYKVINY